MNIEDSRLASRTQLEMSVKLNANYTTLYLSDLPNENFRTN